MVILAIITAKDYSWLQNCSLSILDSDPMLEQI